MNNDRRWAAREIKSPLRRYARLCASAYRRRGEVDVASPINGNALKLRVCYRNTCKTYADRIPQL